MAVIELCFQLGLQSARFAFAEIQLLSEKVTLILEEGATELDDDKRRALYEPVSCRALGPGAVTAVKQTRQMRVLGRTCKGALMRTSPRGGLGPIELLPSG